MHLFVIERDVLGTISKIYADKLELKVIKANWDVKEDYNKHKGKKTDELLVFWFEKTLHWVSFASKIE